jgi:ATP phosphoribosyltransferase
VIAVPAAWIDVETLDDLDAASGLPRGAWLPAADRHEIPPAGARFPDAHGVADYQLVDSQGATEGTVKNLTAEAIADITSTGETLRDANHLKILSDGLIHPGSTVHSS